MSNSEYEIGESIENFRDLGKVDVIDKTSIFGLPIFKDAAGSLWVVVEDNKVRVKQLWAAGGLAYGIAN
jgi:hypothetical protein